METPFSAALKSLLVIIGTAALAIYVLDPQRLAWCTFEFPDWLHWTGVGMAVAAISMHVWVHRALGKNFYPFLHVRENHTLVSSGPYRWIRHPMYTALGITLVAWFLLSANWLIGLTWFSLAVIVAFQVGREEALMIEVFGEQYQAYIELTGRFLPRLANWKPEIRD
jgi:protein-S-isoprenylcysteine O-methyltransferase Ste14